MTDNIVVLQALVRDLDKLLRDSWKERDALKAEITAMKQQEPAGGVVHNGESAALYDIREQGALLYTLPGAEHAPSEEARLVSYCPDGNTCTLNINGVEMYYDRIDMDATPAPSVPEGFSREDLEAVAAGLDGYEKRSMSATSQARVMTIWNPQLPMPLGSFAPCSRPPRRPSHDCSNN
jgi:hypothetical protein